MSRKPWRVTSTSVISETSRLGKLIFSTTSGAQPISTSRLITPGPKVSAGSKLWPGS